MRVFRVYCLHLVAFTCTFGALWIAVPKPALIAVRAAQVGTSTNQLAQNRYIIVRGRYSNFDYSYSVVVPKGLIGRRSRSPSPNHGFIINLPFDGRLVVDASYNSAEWHSFDEAIKAHSDLFSEVTQRPVMVSSRRRSQLGNLKAIRFKLQSTSSQTNESIIRDILLAFRPVPNEVGIVYELALTTPSSPYGKHKALLEQMRMSFRLKSLAK
jgi:hypothetical protein